jgi:hypothetical protein
MTPCIFVDQCKEGAFERLQSGAWRASRQKGRAPPRAGRTKRGLARRYKPQGGVIPFPC